MKIIRLKIKRSYKITASALLLALYFIMPFIDTTSGIFSDSVPLWQIYRALLFGYMFFLLLMRQPKLKFVVIGVVFIIFCVIQTMISVLHIDSIRDVVKLFTPIIAISLFDILIKKNKVDKNSIFQLLDVWSVLYPILIIVPGILGIGMSTYGSGVGWKGFFYSANETSFIMSSLFMYQAWKLNENMSLKTGFVLLLNCICIILLGTKTGYATIAVFAASLLLNFMKKKEFNQRIKIIAILVFIGVVALVGYRQIQDLITGIFDRWSYQRNVFSNSTIDFLTSHRLRRWQDAFSAFTNGRVWYPLIGWGFGGELAGFQNMEMDFLDLLFKTGIFGLVFVCAFYIKKLLEISKKNIWGLLIMGWSLLMSFGAGHVLFYGSSGMMLAVNFTCAFLIKRGRENYTENATK